MLMRNCILLFACYSGLVYGAAHDGGCKKFNEVVQSMFSVQTVKLPVEQGCQFAGIVVPFVTGSVREKQHMLASLLSLKSGKKKQFDGIVGFAYGPLDQKDGVRSFAKSIEQKGYIDEQAIPESYGCEIYTMSKTEKSELSVFQGADKLQHWRGIIVPSVYQQLLEQVVIQSIGKLPHEVFTAFQSVAEALCEHARDDASVCPVQLVDVPVLVRSNLRSFNEQVFG